MSNKQAKKSTPKGNAKAKAGSSTELTEEQLEQVAGGVAIADTVKLDTAQKFFKELKLDQPLSPVLKR